MGDGTVPLAIVLYIDGSFVKHKIPARPIHRLCVISTPLVELVEQHPAMRCVVGSIPAGSALEVWPWTSVLNSLVG